MAKNTYMSGRRPLRSISVLLVGLFPDKDYQHAAILSHICSSREVNQRRLRAGLRFEAAEVTVPEDSEKCLRHNNYHTQ